MKIDMKTGEHKNNQGYDKMMTDDRTRYLVYTANFLLRKFSVWTKYLVHSITYQQYVWSLKSASAPSFLH